MPTLFVADDFTGRLELEVTPDRPGTPFVISSASEGLTYIKVQPADPAVSDEYQIVFCPVGERDPDQCNLVLGLGVGGDQELLVAGPPGRVVIVLTPAD